MKTLAIALESKMEGKNEKSLTLVSSDTTESVVTEEELAFYWPDEMLNMLR